MNDSKRESIEALTQSIGWKVFSEIEERSASFRDSAWWENKVIEWCMSDDDIKMQVLRFIDVFPALPTDKEIVKFLIEYFPHPKQRLPILFRVGEQVAKSALLTPGAAARAIEYSIKKIALQFISGDDVSKALAVLAGYRKKGLLFTMDILGEAVVSEKEADQYMQEYLVLLNSLQEGLGTQSNEINISIKLSSLYSQFDPIHPEKTADEVLKRLKKILSAAEKTGSFVNIDVEHYAYRDLTMAIFQRILDECPGSSNLTGIVVQAYLKDSYELLANLIDLVKDKGKQITVRLVKGAYWDYEVINSLQKNWAIPVFTKKHETDANFERLSELLCKNHKYTKVAIASHNIRSIARSAALANAYKVPPERFEFQMLYGMGDQIATALVKLGYNVRIYTPYGKLFPGMAYLVRRVLENTSNESFLRQSFTENTPKEKLLAPPNAVPVKKNKSTNNEKREVGGFVNCPLTDFSYEENRDAMSYALCKVRGDFGKKYPLVIDSTTIETEKLVESVNPSEISEIVGYVSQADISMADKSIESADKAFAKWSRTSVNDRAEYLFNAAKLMWKKRFNLSATIVLECGKTWREADADVVEAIDFLEYYAYEIMKLGIPVKTDDIPGEDNFYGYRPRGVGFIVAPWNFPLAILTGMTAGALAAGNSVIMKPSNNSPVIGYKLMEIFLDAGIPSGVVNYLPGQGNVIGDYIVKKKEIDFITFTGSVEVGLRIKRLASQWNEGDKKTKTAIMEMGGKNAIIIDNSADLDEAVKATIYSAFGYGGQKCSAASRIIVLKDIYPLFLQRFLEGIKSISIGKADDPSSYYGPLIDRAAVEKVMNYVEIGKKDGNLELDIDVGDLAKSGYFVGPKVFTDVSPDSQIAQEEIFGPIVCLMKANDFQEAIDIANNSKYALTAGLFSRSPGKIEYAKKELEAGNIYINRSITGAVVSRQPFGGFKMSGIGSKAGGFDYIKQFMYPVTVSENTIRHGYSPMDL